MTQEGAQPRHLGLLPRLLPPSCPEGWAARLAVPSAITTVLRAAPRSPRHRGALQLGPGSVLLGTERSVCHADSKQAAKIPESAISPTWQP